jgi:hypothetical protein
MELPTFRDILSTDVAYMTKCACSNDDIVAVSVVNVLWPMTFFVCSLFNDAFSVTQTM